MSEIAVESKPEKKKRRKGGTIGCGYEMKDGELPEQTLRRMEKERSFR